MSTSSFIQIQCFFSQFSPSQSFVHGQYGTPLLLLPQLLIPQIVKPVKIDYTLCYMIVNEGVLKNPVRLRRVYGYLGSTRLSKENKCRPPFYIKKIAPNLIQIKMCDSKIFNYKFTTLTNINSNQICSGKPLIRTQ